MSDPQPDRLKPRPPRAAPLQPDKPGSGADALQTPEKSADQLAEAAAAKQREQTQTALENTRNGYG